jgi:K+ transporter
LALTVGALGVVVGDIGTSLPLERTVVMGSQIPL